MCSCSIFRFSCQDAFDNPVWACSSNHSDRSSKVASQVLEFIDFRFQNVNTFIFVKKIKNKMQVRDIPCGTKGGVMITFEKIEVCLSGFAPFLTRSLTEVLTFSLFKHWLECFLQVVNRLRKDYVHETLLNYGVNYDNTWIYDKIHHEINQFCSSHTLQDVYIDVFDQARKTAHWRCLWVLWW